MKCARARAHPHTFFFAFFLWLRLTRLLLHEQHRIWRCARGNAHTKRFYFENVWTNRQRVVQFVVMTLFVVALWIGVWSIETNHNIVDFIPDKWEWERSRMRSFNEVTENESSKIANYVSGRPYAAHAEIWFSFAYPPVRWLAGWLVGCLFRSFLIFIEQSHEQRETKSGWWWLSHFQINTSLLLYQSNVVQSKFCSLWSGSNAHKIHHINNKAWIWFICCVWLRLQCNKWRYDGR